MDVASNGFDAKDLQQRVEQRMCANEEIRHAISDRGFSYEYHYANKAQTVLAAFTMLQIPIEVKALRTGQISAPCHWHARHQQPRRIHQGGAAGQGQVAKGGTLWHDVRFTPKSGHRMSALGCPLCAKSRHSAVRKKTLLFDHFVGDGD